MADADAGQQPAARNRNSIAVPAPVHAAPLRITKRDIASAGGDTLLIGLSFTGQSFKRGSFGIRTTFVDAPTQPSAAESASKSAKKAWNEQRPKTRDEREMGCHPASGVLVGMRLDELVGALMRFGKPRSITEQLASLARQADAALETCEGIDATTLRMGLLCMAECRAQTLARGPESGRREERKAIYGIVFPTTEGISTSLVVGPTLAIIFAYEWLLDAGCDDVGIYPFRYDVDRMVKALEGWCDCCGAQRMTLSCEDQLRVWLDAEARALRRVLHAGDPRVHSLKAMLRCAKLAAWPRNETLDPAQQRRLLQVVGDEVPDSTYHHVRLKLKGYKTPSEMVGCQFENGGGKLLGTDPWSYPTDALITNDMLSRVLVAVEHEERTRVPRPILHTFYIDGREVAGTLGDMIAEGEDEEHKTDEERGARLAQEAMAEGDALDDDDEGENLVLRITYKRDYAFSCKVEAEWPAWERGGCDGEAKADPPSETDLAADAEARVRLAKAETLSRERLVYVLDRLGTLASTHQPEPEQKEARFLHAGMLALAASDPAVDTFELAAGMLLPEGGQAMYATQVLQRVVADLERRRSNGADAPPPGKPANRKAKRGEQVVVCSIPEHRIVLADCLEDAFVAFTSTSAEAKAAQAAFKAKVARPNRATGSANAVEE
jgi:hypothetical protein